MIVFGGYASGPLSDVWALSLGGGDGSWAQITPSGSPPDGRWLHAAAYDDVNSRMVVFGGWGSSARLADSFALNVAASTSTWSQLAASSAPTPGARSSVRAVYDSTNERFFVFGGATTSGSQSDTWMLNLPLPTLSLAKTADYSSPLVAGTDATVTYTVSLTNSSTNSAAVGYPDRVTDTLPQGFSYVSGSTSGTVGAIAEPTTSSLGGRTQVVWSWPAAINPGNSGSFSFRAKIGSAAEISSSERAGNDLSATMSMAARGPTPLSGVAQVVQVTVTPTTTHTPTVTPTQAPSHTPTPYPRVFVPLALRAAGPGW